MRQDQKPRKKLFHQFLEKPEAIFHMLVALHANIRIYYLKSSHVVDNTYYSWTMTAQGNISHTWKHHSSLIQTKTQH